MKFRMIAFVGLTTVFATTGCATYKTNGARTPAADSVPSNRIFVVNRPDDGAMFSFNSLKVGDIIRIDLTVPALDPSCESTSVTDGGNPFMVNNEHFIPAKYLGDTKSQGVFVEINMDQSTPSYGQATYELLANCPDELHPKHVKTVNFTFSR